MSNTEMQTAASVRSKIAEAMECYVCKNIMDGNIYMCEIGHSVCGICKTSLRNTCGKCRNNLTNKRNYQLEQLIEEIKTLIEIHDNMGLLACAFSEYGCKERMDLENIQEHEKECQKRMIHCPFANKGCPEFSSRETIESHEHTCQFRTIQCVHGCKGDIPIAEITDHYSLCENGEFPCRFWKEGCAEIMRFSRLRDHEVECIYRSVHCTFSKIGCGAVGKFEDIEDHESNCPFRTTSCSFLRNGCEAKLSLSERADHEYLCKFKTKRCIFAKNGCTEVGEEEGIQQHVSSCKFATFPCIFNQKGCSIVLRLPEMEKHELVCEFRLTSCIFSTSGCTATVKISELEQHEKKCKFLSRRIKLKNFSDKTLRCEKCNSILNSEVFLQPSTGALPTSEICCKQCSQKKFGGFRNNGFENLIKEIKNRFLLACMYNYNGCEQFLDLKDKTHHEIGCEFRDVDCKYSTCTWKGKIGLLVTHTLEHKKLCHMIFKKNRYYSNRVLNQHKTIDSIMLKADKELFYCTIKKKNAQMYWAVQLIGRTSVANMYTYKIKIFKENEEHMGKEVCEADSENIEDLISKMRCVCVPYNIVEKFMIDEKLSYKIVIEKQLP